MACERTRAEGPQVVTELIDDVLLDLKRELPAERDQQRVSHDYDGGGWLGRRSSVGVVSESSSGNDVIAHIALC